MGMPMRLMSKAKFIDPKELRELGVLQEVNRRILHPLGLALAVRQRRKHYRPRWEVVGIIDHRDDPEGIIFPATGGSAPTREKFDAFNRLWEERVNPRIQSLGFVEQPLPTKWDRIQQISLMVEDLVEQEERREQDRERVVEDPIHTPDCEDKFEPDPELVASISTNLRSYAQQEMNLESGDLPYRLARQLKIDEVI